MFNKGNNKHNDSAFIWDVVFFWRINILVINFDESDDIWQPLKDIKLYGLTDYFTRSISQKSPASQRIRVFWSLMKKMLPVASHSSLYAASV